jgi:glycosyltransferase involved in cell wall biosynthesis
MDLSVIIPSRNSGDTNFCSKTIQDILDKSEKEIEVIVYVEEKWPDPLIQDPRVHYIKPPMPQGLRTAVNEAVKLAKGKYIMKIDDHCLVGQGFDRILIENHGGDNWVQIPRRYALDAENWKVEDRGDNKYPIDYMYIDFPRKGKAHDSGMHGVPWKRPERDSITIDDTPTMQGSCYFMTRNYFVNVLKGLDPTNYGHFAQESQEINFKTWLTGGRCVVNKKTYYAHLHKGNRYGRMYKLDDADHKRGAEWSAEHWLNNEEPNMTYPFSWLINEKFPGMPSWPMDWEQQIRSMGWIK